jgi:hypothetical protein
MTWGSPDFLEVWWSALSCARDSCCAQAPWGQYSAKPKSVRIEDRQYLLVANLRPKNDPIRLSMKAPIIPRHQRCTTAIGTPS